LGSGAAAALELGLDVGATLAKIVRSEPGAEPAFELLPSDDLDAVAAHVAKLAPARVGLTGGGAARLAQRLELPVARINEFDAWGAGAVGILAAGGEDRPGPDERFLLVSLGTGTSVLLVDGDKATRVGGTALGGGSVVGLGAALCNCGFDELCALAELGSAAGVDLRVSDIYGPDEIPLAGDLTAANFGKLARDPGALLGGANSEDLAAGVMGLVGENVSLICAGLAAATQATRVVYGGSTIRHNPCLVSVLREISTFAGLRPAFLPHGEFAGALGALELARGQS
jgi:type II pantothenate kinase